MAAYDGAFTVLQDEEPRARRETAMVCQQPIPSVRCSVQSEKRNVGEFLGEFGLLARP
jgi:hypothetical protein